MSLDFKKMQETLQGIYQRYESEAGQFKEQAVCGRGCSFCCSDMGKIDIVTVEGIILLERMEFMPETEAKEISQGLERDRTLRWKGKKSTCPFLDEQGACRVYHVRPFSCRQLYSLRKCDQGGPLVHKQAVSLVRKIVRDIQKLDDTGYSGHHSFILKLLQNQTFRNTYSAGGFDPGSIKKFGKKHGIIINRFAKELYR
ncbi:MAG: YkgJ family cysteine cluster protein [Desulfobulbaceae bacterium]|nr:YkgJ family cysteine cluster protein [Desulfobulbaceae bacterium]